MESNWKKNIILFITGQAITFLGSMVVQYAILWHITLTTQSGLMMTLFSIIGFFPMFFISPFGGVWADRYNRKKIINISDGIIALVSLIVAILLIFGHTHFIILLVCAAVRALGQGVQTPAVGAVIPQIVPKEHLTKINGINSSIQSICSLVAPMLGGIIMNYTSLQIIFFIDVVTAIIGISILVFFVKVPNLEKIKTDIKVGYFHELMEGLRYIKNHGFVFRLIVFCGIFSIFAAPAFLLSPLQVVRNFGDDVWRLSATQVASSIGMIFGGILIAIWGGFKNKTYTLALSCFIFGLSSIGLGIMSNFIIYVGIMVFAGIIMPLFDTPSTVMLQATVEQEYMGRVFSVSTMVSTATMPLAMILFGPLADIININIIFIITGILIAFSSLYLLLNNTLREAGNVNI